jgi:hypothetical protein
LTDLIQRVGVWEDMLPGLRPWGHGLGSFIAEFPLYQHHTTALTLRFENAHNDFMQLAFELGIGAVLAAALVIAQLWGTPRSPAWYAMVVFLVEGCFGFPLYEPVTASLAAVCAGALFAEHVVLFDLLATWGPRVWASNFAPRRRPHGAVKPAVSSDSQLPVWTSLSGHRHWGSGARHSGDRGGLAA